LGWVRMLGLKKQKTTEAGQLAQLWVFPGLRTRNNSKQAPHGIDRCGVHSFCSILRVEGRAWKGSDGSC